MSESASIRVVLADDHPLVRGGLRQLLEQHADVAIVGEAATGEEAWRVVRERMPDVLVSDVTMPDVGGAELIRRITAAALPVRVLILTVHEEPTFLNVLLRAGAAGYVLKRTAVDELMRAIRTVAAGGTYVDPSLTHQLVRGVREAAEPVASAPALSAREREVLAAVARGFSNKEIADALGLSIKTVETYKARACEKLGLLSRTEIVRYAVGQDWL